MPKKTRDFPDRLEFQVPHDMRVKLIALSFLTGHGAQYSATARSMLHQAIETAVAGLAPARRKDYDEILGNVHEAYPPPERDMSLASMTKKARM